MLPSPFATFYLFHTIHTDEWYLSWLRPTLSITLLLIHTNCFLKRSNARNRGHTGHSNWSWELLLIKVWEEFMEIIDSLWLNISSGVICYQCYLEDNNYISQEFLEAFFICLSVLSPQKNFQSVPLSKAKPRFSYCFELQQFRKQVCDVDVLLPSQLFGKMAFQQKFWARKKTTIRFFHIPDHYPD